MRKGDIRTVKINGKPVEAEFIGKGMFAKAYRLTSTGRVVCFCGDDRSKEILTRCNRSRHLPQVERVDGPMDTQFIVEMPFYKRLTSTDREAWRQYKALKQAAHEAHYSRSARKERLQGCAYEVNCAIASNARVDNILKEALAELAHRSMEHGPEYAFEFAPRNLGVDPDGFLILLDVVFNSKALLMR